MSTREPALNQRKPGWKKHLKEGYQAINEEEKTINFTSLVAYANNFKTDQNT